MKIKNIDGRSILFDNGNEIQVYHEIECCESVYADFEQIDSIAYDLEFNEDLKFENISGYGFRFGNNEYNMVAVPCYDCQNGCYSSDLKVLYYHTHFAPEEVLDSESYSIYSYALEDAVNEGYVDKNLTYDEQVRYFVKHEEEIYEARNKKLEAMKMKEVSSKKVKKEYEKNLEDSKTLKYMDMFKEPVELKEVPILEGEDEDKEDR